MSVKTAELLLVFATFVALMPGFLAIRHKVGDYEYQNQQHVQYGGVFTVNIPHGLTLSLGLFQFGITSLYDSVRSSLGICKKMEI